MDEELPPVIVADDLPDDLEDRPGEDSLNPDTLVMDTPYTTPMPLLTDTGMVLPEPIPDDTEPAVTPSQVTAVIRTVVPFLVGGIIAALAWLLRPLGLAVPEGATEWLTSYLPVVLGALYYAVAKLLERRWPQVPWLGSRRQPLYTPPATFAAATLVSTLASVGYVWWKGGKFTPTMRDALVALDTLTPDVPIVLTQGGFNGTNVSASAGTHAGDAADISVRGLTQAQVTKLIETARMLGLAAWFRTTDTAKWGTRAQGFGSYHIHIVPNGWGAPSQSAKAQVNATRNGRPAGYRNGRDGLASNQADIGPGHVSVYRTRTWAGYLATKTPPVPSPGTPKPDIIPRTYTPKPWALVAVDGILGPQTLRRLQMTLNVVTTGVLDHYSIRALKVWLGNADDGRGILSPLNVQQLQYRVGVTRDGQWGPVTTRALQAYLNKHR